MLQIYLVAVAVFGILIGVTPISAMVAHAQNDNDNDNDQNNNNEQNDNSPQNKACYNAGYADGQQNNPYSQKMLNQCTTLHNGRAYYEGFLSGCISGQGKNYFSCQRLTNSPVSGSNGNGNGGGGGGGSNGNGGGGGGGGGFGPFGGGGRSH
jgi:hypothetical protein